METPQEFSARAAKLLARAQALSYRQGEDSAALNGWMMEAKRQKMTWIEGLAFAVDQMKARAQG
jgi:hypothetical protein